jgi:hypothetical protein
MVFNIGDGKEPIYIYSIKEREEVLNLKFNLKKDY